MFGHQEGVNGVDPATIGDFYRYDFTAGSLTADGALVDEGFATEHGLKVGSTLSITSMSGKTLDLTVSGIEKSPVLDVLGLGPITISHAAFDATFEQERNRLTFADHDATPALQAFPNAKAQTKAEFIDGQTAWIGIILAILWVLLALAVIVSLFGIVNTLVLSTFERMRELGHAAGARLQPPADPADGPARERDHGADRREHRDRGRAGARGGGRPAAGRVRAAASASRSAACSTVAIIAGLAGMLAATMPARRAAKIDVLKALAYE